MALSEYSEVWRTLLLMTAATTVIAKSGTPEFFQRFTKLGALKNVIDDFYEKAFAPEIVKMLNFVEASEASSSLIAKYMGSGPEIASKQRTEQQSSASLFQTNLLQIRKAFEAALAALRMEQNFLVFIDGIDVRPSDIAYSDYFECVRGLHRSYLDCQ